jgi:hypothetical protein
LVILGGISIPQVISITHVIVSIQPIMIAVDSVVRFGRVGDARPAVVTEKREFLARCQITVGIDPRGVLDGVLVVVDESLVTLEFPASRKLP